MKLPPKYVLPLIATSLTVNSLLLGYVYLLETKEERTQNEHPLLAKRILIQRPNDVLINFIPLRKVLREYAESYGDKIGIYFEYLPSGTSIGINSTDEVKLASLSKIPLAMSIMKKASSGKLALTDVVTLKQEHIDSNYGDGWKLGAGAKLTIEELLKLALQKSDNTAYKALFDLLTGEEVNAVYSDLDIEVNKEVINGQLYPIISPKAYSSIFRSLYLSSYLSEEDSSYLLKILTESIFKDTIEAPIPKSIPVAHKVGIFKSSDLQQDVYIDCGLIYNPLRPYILCIFIKDTTEETADAQLAHISNLIYLYISSVNK